MITRRGSQDKYNSLLNAFNAKNKTKSESITYLTNLGFSREQAENAVHVFWKGGQTSATFILPGDERNQLLDNFGATKKSAKECVEFLMINHGCTYRQANSAVYKYRQEKGLIGK